jgi:hypothetical protein
VSNEVFAAEVLPRSVHEIAERITELHDLRGRVRQAEASARARRWYKSSTRPRRRREFHRLRFVMTLSAATIGARHLSKVPLARIPNKLAPINKTCLARPSSGFGLARYIDD